MPEAGRVSVGGKVPGGTLTVPVGGPPSFSTVLSLAKLRAARSIGILAPATLDGGVTFTVMVSHLDSTAAADFRALQSAGADVTLAANKALAIVAVPFRALAIQASGGAVVAERVFQIVIDEQDAR